MYSYRKGNGNAHTQKTVNGVTHNYFYAGGKLMRQTDGTNTLDFFYDESGHPYALKYNGTAYYYVTNLQGDVLHIVNNAGTAVVSYTYDPYGKPLTTTGSMASTLGAHNPLRYRGYVYDSETGFYYLQSRYYDPAICRFINADSYASTGQGILGHNMFSYCRNNPVLRKDASGTDDVCATDFNEDNNPLNDLGNPSGGGGGRGLGVKSSYYTSQRVQAYDWQWQNSRYNQSTPSVPKPSSTLLPEKYWASKKAPLNSTPNSSYTNVRYNDHTGEWEFSTAYYDLGGRQFMRIDWTDHGYPDHGNPHIHHKIFDPWHPMGINGRMD